MVLVEELVYVLMEEVLYLGENQRMAKFVRLFVVALVFAFGVFAFEFDGGYGITDCGECLVVRVLSEDLAVVLTEYGCSSVSCAYDFLLKSLSDDFLGVDCLVASLYEQLGDSKTRGALGLVLGC